jgi:hypothetical protein
MDLEKVLQQLHEELENLNAAISSLERLQEVSKHRGKEPDWLGDLTDPALAVRKRKGKPKGEAPKEEPGVETASESD